ncbi:MAG: DUF4920 domain-containing protein [Bacteroidetes bacterium]|nr:DUF4920 domain-containing protein [Bacteroidia bacterium]MBN8695132.1 DUF4920 domain-containing protein [Bacteroidota bacterium]
MKKLLFAASIATFFLSACGNHQEETKTEVSSVDTSLMYFGDSITMDGAVAADQLMTQLTGKDSIQVKLTGTIAEVCQKKGCWMNMNIGNDKSMKVRFKDYAFFMPKDAAGKTVFIEGWAYNDTIPVNELKHYAEDAGQTKEEIEKITEPEISISFEANGVIIKK